MDVSAPQPPSQPAAKPNPFARIVGVLMSPGETFASIASRPDWVVPAAIILLLALAGSLLIATKVDFQALGREAIEMNPRAAEMSASQAESAAGMTAGIMRISTFLSPVLVLLALLVVSAILLVSFRAMGGEGDFRAAFAVTVYAWFPRVIKGLLGLIVLMSRQSISMLELQNPLMSNLGFLFDPRTKPLQFALASSIDIFTIWSVILLVIGFAAMARVSRAKSAAIVVGWWIVVNLVSLIGPAMQAMRR